MYGKFNFIGFCFCGLPLPCPRCKDKKKPEQRKRIGRYSGFSKTFVANKGSEELMEEGE